MSGSEFASSAEHAEWCWAADPESVPSARHAVLDFLEDEHDLDPALADVALAVSEAVANVVLHAYPDGPCGMVQQRLTTSNGFYSAATPKGV